MNTIFCLTIHSVIHWFVCHDQLPLYPIGNGLMVPEKLLLGQEISQVWQVQWKS